MEQYYLFFYNKTLGWESDTYSQFVGVPGTILEFIGAILGGFLQTVLEGESFSLLGGGVSRFYLELLDL